jgi:cytochrome c
MKRDRAIAAACIGVLAASFLLARVHPFGDPRLYAKSGPVPILDRSGMPPEVRAMMLAKCADCHSAQPRPPLYGRFAPASWLIERDVLRARSAMDLSKWDSYSTEDQHVLMAKILHEVKQCKMPPVQYLAAHWNAQLTEEDVRIVTRWAGTLSSGSATFAAALPEGDAGRGRAVFEKRCTGCHALNRNREGPRLQDVYGRNSGSVKNFSYSDSLARAHIIWNDATLDRWLSGPQAFIPGSDMDFYVAIPRERADLIRFLRQQSGK